MYSIHPQLSPIGPFSWACREMRFIYSAFQMMMIMPLVVDKNKRLLHAIHA